MEHPIKILIHCPIGILDEGSYKSVLELDTEGLEVDVLFTFYNPYPPRYDGYGRERNPQWMHNIAYKMNKARDVVLKNNYDFLFNIEHDMIVPKDALKTLLKYAKPDNVVGGLYRSRKLRDPRTPLCLKIKYPDGRICWPTLDEIKGKEVIDNVYVIPFGCTLIGRKVLEQVEFDRGIDGSFARETDKLKIEKLIVPSVICGHIERNGKIWWPDEQEG